MTIGSAAHVAKLTHSMSRESNVSRDTRDPTKPARPCPSSRVFCPLHLLRRFRCWRRSPPSPKAATPSPATSRRRPASRRSAKDAQRQVDEFAEAAARSAARPAIRNASGSAAGWSACCGATTSTPRSGISISTTGSAAPGRIFRPRSGAWCDKGSIDPKAPESLSARVHACWLNPASPPRAATSAANPAPPGTTARSSCVLVAARGVIDGTQALGIMLSE